MISKNYIWTNHALTRLNERKIPKELVIQALTNPDRTNSKIDNGVEYIKKIENQTVAAIVKENESGEKIIVSVWMNPPLIGTKDFKRRQRYYQMQNATFLKKFWLTFLTQIGF